MVKDEITLKGFTVVYGQTTVAELCAAGFRVAAVPWDYERESQTALYEFFKDDHFLGLLAFYGSPEGISADELQVRPINLVLPEDEPQVGGRAATFLRNIGIATRRDLIFLGVGYGLCLLCLLLWHAEIPTLLTVFTLVLPAAYLAVALVHWGVKSALLTARRRLPVAGFVTLCLVLWLLWNFANGAAFSQLQVQTFWYKLIPLALVLITAGFIQFHLLALWVGGVQPRYRRAVVGIHLALFAVSIAAIFWFSRPGLSISRIGGSTGSALWMTGFFLTLQVIIYGLAGGVGLMRFALGVFTRQNKPTRASRR